MKNKITHSLSFATKTLLLVAVIFFGIQTTKAQIITTIAGNGTSGFSGDSGMAVNGELYNPRNICMDRYGNIYFIDLSNKRIRKINTSGIITTIAGNGSSSMSAHSGLATSTGLYYPFGLAIDAMGNIYFADLVRVYKIDTSDIITTIAGGGTIPVDSGGPSEPATSIILSSPPTGVAVDASGNVYIATVGTIQEVNTSDSIWVVATGLDGGSVSMWDIKVDRAGNIYTADKQLNCIWKINTFGITTIVAGRYNVPGFSGDSGLATAAEINNPWAIALDDSDNIYIADEGNNRVRKVTASTGIITTVAGNGTQGWWENDVLATSAAITAEGVFVGPCGNIYISNDAGGMLRKVIYPTTYNDVHSDTINTNIPISTDTSVVVRVDTIVNAQTSIIITTTDSVFITTHSNTIEIVKDSVVFTVQCTNVDSVVYADTTSISNTDLDTVVHESSDTTTCSITTHSQIMVHRTDTNALEAVDTLIEVYIDTLFGSVTKVITRTDTVLISTYLSTVATIRDSVIFSVNQCDSSVTTITYADTVEDLRTNYDTVTHQSSDTSNLLNTSIENVGLPLMIKAYPNPFHAELNIDVGNEVSTIVLTDALGRTVMQMKQTGHIILRPNVLSGIYFLRVTDKNKSSTTIKVIAE